MKRLVLLFLLVLMAAGCAPWVKTDSPVTSRSLQFEVTPPQGWMRRNSDNQFHITRDGFSLQSVTISRVKVSENKQFAHTKRRVSADMLPQEIAEVFIDEYQSDTTFPFEAVEENAPEKIAEQPACRIRLTYRDKAGLKYRCQIYAFVTGDWFYWISYTAPARHYFDRDLPAIEAMVRTFRLTRQ